MMSNMSNVMGNAWLMMVVLMLSAPTCARAEEGDNLALSNAYRDLAACEAVALRAYVNGGYDEKTFSMEMLLSCYKKSVSSGAFSAEVAEAIAGDSLIASARLFVAYSLSGRQADAEKLGKEIAAESERLLRRTLDSASEVFEFVSKADEKIGEEMFCGKSQSSK